jgi:mRNA interferase RelE/StbE
VPKQKTPPAKKTSGTAKEPAKAKHKYRLKFVPSALKEWQALDGSIKENMRQLLKARLDNPHVPGSALKGELRGYYKIKLLKQGYRLVYGVEDDALIVMVMAVDKREDAVVYAAARARLGERAKELAKSSEGPDETAKK